MCKSCRPKYRHTLVRGSVRVVAGDMVVAGFGAPHGKFNISTTAWPNLPKLKQELVYMHAHYFPKSGPPAATSRGSSDRTCLRVR